MAEILKKEYPNLEDSEYKKALSFLKGKCSEYYFIDYMRCSNGNVDDAINFYLFDDGLRFLLIKYIIRFEIQAKADFVNIIEEITNCSSFWKRKEYYLPDTLHVRAGGRHSKFYLLKEKIESNLNRKHFSSLGSINHTALYVSSFGTFQELFKYIDQKYKFEFIENYTHNLNLNDYHTLNAFLEGIRIVRNRCAHGNHIISRKMSSELKKLKTTIRCQIFKDIKSPITPLEGIILYLLEELESSKEFKSDIKCLIEKNSYLIEKYNKKLSLSKFFPMLLL